MVEFNSIESAPTLAQLTFNNEWTSADYVSDSYAQGDILISPKLALNFQ